MGDGRREYTGDGKGEYDEDGAGDGGGESN